MPSESKEAAAILGELGVFAFRYGQYDAAIEWTTKSLEIKEKVGHFAGMAPSYHVLGVIAHKRGKFDMIASQDVV